MSDRGEVHADLVCAPGVQVRPQQVSGIEARQPGEVRPRRPSSTDDRHARSVSRVTSDRLVDREAILTHVPPCERCIATNDAPRLELRADGESVRGVTAIVQNGSPFTYFRDRPIEVAEGARLDSGTLSAAVLRRARFFDMPTLAWRAFAHRARVLRHRQVTGFEALSELSVRTTDGRELPLQIDGDYAGHVAEARYSIKPRALRIVS